MDMPLNNRSVLDLALTAGNVTGVAGTEDRELGSEIPAPGFNVNVNGGRAGSTSILADGANNTGVGLGTRGRDVLARYDSGIHGPDLQLLGGVRPDRRRRHQHDHQVGHQRLSTGLLYWYHRNPALNAAPFTTATNNRPQSNRRQHQFGLTWADRCGFRRNFRAATTATTARSSSSRYEPRYYYDGTQFAVAAAHRTRCAAAISATWCR